MKIIEVKPNESAIVEIGVFENDAIHSAVKFYLDNHTDDKTDNILQRLKQIEPSTLELHKRLRPS